MHAYLLSADVVLSDAVGLISISVGSFPRKMGSSEGIFLANVIQHRRLISVRAVHALRPLHLVDRVAGATSTRLGPCL
jgi:hypothetical protein